MPHDFSAPEARRTIAPGERSEPGARNGVKGALKGRWKKAEVGAMSCSVAPSGLLFASVPSGGSQKALAPGYYPAPLRG